LVNQHDLSCGFCLLIDKDTTYLFISCPFSQGVWKEVLKWLGKDLPVGSEGWNHFMLFGDLIKLKDDGRVRYLIWLAITWNIWRLCNNVIFKGVGSEASYLLDDIKVFSWMGLTSRFGRNSYFPFFLSVY
jgi:hypothetical protein